VSEIASPVRLRLREKFCDRGYRNNYVSAHTRYFLARQIRALRGTMSQQEFAARLGKKQAVVSRWENPNYGAMSLRTLFEIAEAFDVALFVRFVSCNEFLRATRDMSPRAARPKSSRRKAD